MLKQIVLFVLTLTAVFVTPLRAQVSAESITYQGVLEESGQPIADGTYTIEFRLYDVGVGGQPIQSIPVSGVQTRRGLFSAVVPMSPSVLNASPSSGLYWAVSLNGAELTPRSLVTSSPFSMATSNLTNTGGAGPLTTGLLNQLPAEGTLDENVWGNYLVASNAADRQLLLGVVNDGFTRAMLQLDSSNQLSGRISLSTVVQSDLRERLSIERDGAVFVRNSTLFIQNRDAPATKRTWGAVVAASTGQLRVGGHDIDAASNGSLSRAPFKIDHAAPNDVLVLQSNGRAQVKVLEIIGGADLAESFPIARGPNLERGPKPGMILSIDPDHPGALRVSTIAYDTAVAGVYSGGNGLPTGMLMGKEGCDLTRAGEDRVPLAMTGRVWVYADESAGDIHPGDRLTTSGTKPGHALKVTDSVRADGAVIGKAMTRIDASTGMVLVLVNLQ